MSWLFWTWCFIHLPCARLFNWSRWPREETQKQKHDLIMTHIAKEVCNLTARRDCCFNSALTTLGFWSKEGEDSDMKVSIQQSKRLYELMDGLRFQALMVRFEWHRRRKSWIIYVYRDPLITYICNEINLIFKWIHFKEWKAQLLI